MIKNSQISEIPNPVVKSLSYKELDILHCLRGFCAFYVVIYHAKYILWAGGKEYMSVFPRSTWGIEKYILFALDMMSSAGYEMVIFFFVLSGFFIRYAQIRKHRDPKAFYINRIVRIYPPYLFSVLLAVGVLWAVNKWVPQVLNASISRELNMSLVSAWSDLRAIDFMALLRTLFFMPVEGKLYLGYNSVYWSLLPEALFYLFVPLAFLRVRSYYIISTVLYLIGIVIGLRHNDVTGIFAYLLVYNFYFAVGAALHDIITTTEWIGVVRRMPAYLLCSVTLILFVFLLPLAVLKLKVFSGLVAVLLAVIAVSALLAGRVSSRNILLRFFHPIGIFSFSLYLYHFPLLILCSAILTSLTGNLIFYARYYWLAIPLVTIGCYLLYWTTERLSVDFFRKK